MLSLSVVIEPTTSFIPMPDSIKAIFEKAFVESALWDMIVSTCILAPLLEELLCRGIMLRGMLARRKAPWKAIVWSALIFAVMHMNPWQSIPAFLIGLLLGWVYYRTHSRAQGCAAGNHLLDRICSRSPAAGHHPCHTQ